MPKIVRFHETGGPEVLKIEDLPLAQPGEGEVRLNVEAIGLNRAEVLFRQGRYLDAPECPSRLGYEAAEAHRLIANNEVKGSIVLLPWAE